MASTNPSFRRRPESSGFIQLALEGVVLAPQGIFFFDWIPACAGMTKQEFFKGSFDES
jgi:hypothetical protein